MTVPTTPAHPAFRQVEKHFKNRATWALPALRDLPRELCHPVLDLSRPEAEADDPVYCAGWWAESFAAPSQQRARKGAGTGAGRVRPRGSRPELVPDARPVKLSDGRVGFVVAEGCVLVPGYLSPEAQLELTVRALADYTLPPNPLSLSTHYQLPGDLFGTYVSDPETVVRPKHLDFDESQRSVHAAAEAVTRGPRTLIETAPAATIGYDEVKRRNAEWTGDAVSLKARERTVAQLLKEVRWANLGWVYQWSTKSYDFSTTESIPFPPELATICKEVVGAVPWEEVYAGVDDAPQYTFWEHNYEPDTGIVNYYQSNDTLMAHVDRSELDPSRPLVSLSLGHACIFLLGTDSRDTPPIPIVLRSGDAFIMSGKGRQNYHGVPRIMEDTLPAHFAEFADDSPEMSAAKRWAQTARININARQVFPPGFQRE